MIDKSIINIQKEYFELINEMFGELYTYYLDFDRSFEKSINKYITNQPTFFVAGYNDNLSLKREMFINKIKKFWQCKAYDITNYIKSVNSVGLFGVGDNIYVNEYKLEMSRNSLFFDLLVFNDPFYTGFKTKEELSIDTNITMFYRNIIYLLDLEKYIIDEDYIFAIIFPFDCLFSDEEKQKTMDDAREEGTKFINEIFGLGHEKFYEDIAVLKETSLEEVQKRLYENGLYYRVDEAMNYSQALISEEQRRWFEEFCFESWGAFNRDFLRCLLLEDVLPNLATVSFYTYKWHKKVAIELKSHPIIARNEWTPIKNEAVNTEYKATEDYLFSCAVHRNDKMEELISIKPEDIHGFREKNQPKEFRDFFHKATEQMYYSYADFEEISKEVYAKFDELLNITLEEVEYGKKREKRKSIIGFAKAGSGFIPFVSYAVSIHDMYASAKDYINTLSDKETIFDYIRKK